MAGPTKHWTVRPRSIPDQNKIYTNSPNKAPKNNHISSDRKKKTKAVADSRDTSDVTRERPGWDRNWSFFDDPPVLMMCMGSLDITLVPRRDNEPSLWQRHRDTEKDVGVTQSCLQMYWSASNGFSCASVISSRHGWTFKEAFYSSKAG